MTEDSCSAWLFWQCVYVHVDLCTPLSPSIPPLGWYTTGLVYRSKGIPAQWSNECQEPCSPCSAMWEKLDRVLVRPSLVVFQYSSPSILPNIILRLPFSYNHLFLSQMLFCYLLNLYFKTTWRLRHYSIVGLKIKQS